MAVEPPVDGTETAVENSVPPPPVFPPPREGMLFDTLSGLMEYYQEYARSKGFKVSITGVEKHGNVAAGGEVDDEQWENEVNKARIRCSRGGGEFKSKSKNPKKTPKSSKTNCEAKINAWRTDEGFWMIHKFVDEHNHEFEKEDSRYISSYRRIIKADKGRLLTNNRAGIPMNKNFQSMVVEKGGIQNVGFTEKDCRNFIDNERRLQLHDGDFAAMQEWFAYMSRLSKDFVHVHENNEEGRLRNVFWVDGRSRSAYKDFGDVISFDATYLKNRYRMPFTPFIGVNHHGQTILFGCGLLSSENTHNYVWLFTQWLQAMGGVAPKGIITDQCPAIGKSISIVFPGTRHRWCLWHVMMNAKRHLHMHEKWKELKARLEAAIYNTLTIDEFEAEWEAIVEDFNLSGYTWVTDMYRWRNMWVPVYFKDEFWAGMSTTQRSEGINNFFKSYVNLNSTLTEFVEQFSLALAKRVNDEAQQTFESRTTPLQLCSDFTFEVIFQETYTNKKFKEFQKQIKDAQYVETTRKDRVGVTTIYTVVDRTKECKWFQPNGVEVEVTYTSSPCAFRCACKNFEFKGILCRHIVKIISIEGIEYVPKYYVHDRWRKDLARNYAKFGVPHYNPRTVAADPGNLRKAA